MTRMKNHHLKFAKRQVEFLPESIRRESLDTQWPQMESSDSAYSRSNPIRMVSGQNDGTQSA